ncbi:MAG: glycosyltransferase family 87 protein [Nitrospirae bacterium]|nr:glycosyltransferase family 87 protein [Nitrospirota bacterium]
MPIASMYFAPLTFFDRDTAMALRYTFAIACLCLTLVLCYRMTRVRSGMTPTHGMWMGAISIVLALQFILQDLDDGGPHLILLGILTAGIYLTWQGREKLGSLWFGLAIALKVTPALFLPFFLWKRRWKLAGYTVIATMCWILLPILYMGPSWWWSLQRDWPQVAVGSVLGHESPATQSNEQQVRNQSLKQTLLRYLVTIPEDHPLRQKDPGYAPVLDLPPSTAKIVVLAVMASLLAFFGWTTRRPYEGRGDPMWLRESSALLIIALLLSPVTWVQHLVWLLPALYLIAMDARSKEGLNLPVKLAMAIYVLLAVVLNYELLGRRNFSLFLTIHPFALAMLLVLGILLLDRKHPDAEALSLSNQRDHVTPPRA